MTAIKKAFPERAADLAQRYLDTRLDEVVGKIFEWKAAELAAWPRDTEVLRPRYLTPQSPPSSLPCMA
jgi:hypothetical protein